MTALEGQHFELEEVRSNGSLTLSLAGELDILSAPVLQRRLRELRRQGRVVRLDLSRLGFIDSTGIQVLIEAWQNAQDAGSQLEFDPNVSSQVSRVLALVNLDRLLLGDDATSR